MNNRVSDIPSIVSGFGSNLYGRIGESFENKSFGLQDVSLITGDLLGQINESIYSKSFEGLASKIVGESPEQIAAREQLEAAKRQLDATNKFSIAVARMTKNSKDEEQRKILEGGEVAKAQQAATSDGFDKVIDSKSEGFITKQLVSDIAVVALPIVAAASQGLTEDNPRIAAAIEDVSAVMPIITALVSTGNPWAIAAAGIVAVGASLWDLFKGWTGWFGGSVASYNIASFAVPPIYIGYGVSDGVAMGLKNPA